MVQEISIDDLNVDPENIRDAEWNPNSEEDGELVESIKKQGVLNPLTVRPHEGLNVEYGIVCGSRRFNAAINAGLDVVPCTIQEMDDVTAAGLSVTENRDRKDVPAYKEAFKVIEHFHRLDIDGKVEKYDVIAEKFGCSRTTVRDYLEIDNLPNDVKELVKDPSEWSTGTKEVVKNEIGDFNLPEKGLSTYKARELSESLKNCDSRNSEDVLTKDSDSLLSFAAQSITKSRDDVSSAAEALASEKDVSVEDSWDVARKSRIDDIPVEDALDSIGDYNDDRESFSKSITITMEIPNQYQSLLEEAALNRSMKREELAKEYMKEGLERDGMDL